MSTPTPPSATIAHSLAVNNLLLVFSNRDAASRRAAIKTTYHPDVKFYEPDEVHTGHDAINAKAKAIQAERADWHFVPQGPVKQNHNMLYLAWGLGPKGPDGNVDVEATGGDVLLVRDGLVEAFWVIIDGVTDVKP